MEAKRGYIWCCHDCGMRGVYDSHSPDKRVVAKHIGEILVPGIIAQFCDILNLHLRLRRASGIAVPCTMKRIFVHDANWVAEPPPAKHQDMDVGLR